MKNAHIHDMRPNRPVLPTRYQCSSCEFKCTTAAVREVENNPRQHRLVKANSPQAREIWGAPHRPGQGT